MTAKEIEQGFTVYVSHIKRRFRYAAVSLVLLLTKASLLSTLRYKGVPKVEENTVKLYYILYCM